MSMMYPAPRLTPRRYSEEWWQSWREEHACVRYDYRETNSRADKRALVRLTISACFGMVYCTVGEIWELLREKYNRNT